MGDSLTSGTFNFEIQEKKKHTLKSFEELFEPSEIVNKLKTFKTQTVAGPDNIGLEALRDRDPEGFKLALVLNAWLVAGQVPPAMKKNRTTLIPKVIDQQKLQDANNWRQITIGSILVRLFTKLLHERLQKTL